MSRFLDLDLAAFEPLPPKAKRGAHMLRERVWVDDALNLRCPACLGLLQSSAFYWNRLEGRHWSYCRACHKSMVRRDDRRRRQNA